MSFLRLRTAWAQVRYAPGRFASMVIVIALAVALSASVLLVSDRLVPLLESSIEAVVGRADLRVVAISPAGLDETLASRIAEERGVAVVAPVIHAPTFVDGDPTRPVTVWGLDFLNEGALDFYDFRSGRDVQLGDPMVFLSQPDSVIAPRDWLEANGLRRGDRVTVTTPGGLASLVVRGVLGGDRGARLGGTPLLVMDVYGAQTLLSREGRFSHVDVLVAKGHDADDVARRIAKLVEGSARVESGAKRQQALRQMLAGFRAIFLTFSMSGLVLSVIVTFSRSTAIFFARQWEAGVSRALGATPAIVQREALKEVFLVAIVGTLLGLPLAVWLASVVAPRLTQTAGVVSGVTFPAIEVSPQPGALLIAALLGIAGTLAGAILPARRAARTPIAGTVATRGVDAGGTLSARAARLLAAALVSVPLLVWLEMRTRWGAAGFAALALVVIAACSLVPVLLRMCVPLVTPLLAAACGAVGRLAATGIERSTQRATGIVRLFAVGLAVVVWFTTIGTSFEQELPRLMGSTRHADLTVGSAFDLGGEMQALDEKLVELVRDVPGVEALSVERSLYGSSVGVSAFDAAHFANPRFASLAFEGAVLPDPLRRVAAGEAVVVTPAFAARRGAGAGDVVTLETPSGHLRLPIAGVARVSAYSPEGDVVLERGLYRRHWKDATITRIHILAPPGTDLAATRRALLRAIGPEHKVRLLSADEMSDYWATLVRRPAVLLRGASLLVLLLVVLGISDAVLIEVLERTRELATMRALGAPPASVCGVIVLEMLVIGLLSSAIALALAFVLSWVLLRGTMPSLVGWGVPVAFDATTCGAALAVALCAALAAVLAPAWRAGRIEPAVALRQE